MCGIAKGMENLVWSFVWCIVAISVISSRQAFVFVSFNHTVFTLLRV